MSILVKLTGIQVRLGGNDILDDITLTIKKGEITTLIGPNGAGKSTLLKVLLGLQPLYSGTIKKYRKFHIGYVPQKINLNYLLPLSVKRFLKLSGKVNNLELRKTLKLVGIENLSENSMHQLSGGENQRVLIARALLKRPDLLVLDEPAQGVDVQGQRELYKLIDKIRQLFSCAVFMASHDLHLVMEKTDNVICLQRRICCAGSPESIKKHPKYAALFGQYQLGLSLYKHHHNHSD
ncbi:zinc import ATP-binding protein [Candidatus Photodesmus katoptron]|uniref:ATP-binding cassette domain-containing protein n=1 Tax=Candidatus Photodesmus anomalopis TaxID=28176 RepID=UPI0004D63426|nr:ATP-binding cassette domain-containing protein [Candidatus Photodesmus katoptron]KEY90161.1 zinc import ATP-binding protein [Candidatus Photodesmus katoptron]